MEYDLNILKQQQDELLTRLNSLSVDSPRMPNDDVYSEIEQAANRLSDVDRQDLMKDPEYQKMVGDLNIYIQHEQFKLVRQDIVKNPKAVELMKKISQYITKFKNDSDAQKADALKTFQDYISNYSDMSYTDYLKCKAPHANDNK